MWNVKKEWSNHKGELQYDYGVKYEIEKGPINQEKNYKANNISVA